jgi:aquaporin Z
MGAAVAMTTFLIIRSPFGRRSGAHLNPAITLTYFWLDRIPRWDALSYGVSQFGGALGGVFIARLILGTRLSGAPVRYVVTTPPMYRTFAALLAEFLLSMFLMGVILLASNHRCLARFTPLIVALLTVFYYVLSTSLSGFSVNPARSFASAMFAWIWQGIWIYFLAPSLGMLTAAAVYVHTMGADRVYCAKVFHDQRTTCPFPCKFNQICQTR